MCVTEGKDSHVIPLLIFCIEISIVPLDYCGGGSTHSSYSRQCIVQLTYLVTIIISILHYSYWETETPEVRLSGIEVKVVLLLCFD